MLVDTGSGKKLSLCGVIVSSELGRTIIIMGPSVMAEINKTTQYITKSIIMVLSTILFRGSWSNDPSATLPENQTTIPSAPITGDLMKKYI